MVVLFATLGTRDVQFIPGIRHMLTNNMYEAAGQAIPFMPMRHADNMVLQNARDAALLNGVPELSAATEVPMLGAAVEYLVQVHKHIDTLVLVCTDQQDAEDYFRKNDTLHYVPLVKKYFETRLKEHCPAIETLLVTEYATDIDHQYVHFRRFFNSNPLVSQATALYLFTQGGIDQVNTALMLRLIEHNPDVKMLQLPERGDIKVLDFPRKFVTNLNKHKALELLEGYHFAGVAALNAGPVQVIAKLADLLLNLSRQAFTAQWHEAARKWEGTAFRAKHETVLKLLQQQAGDTDNTNWPLRIYETAKVRWQQGNTADMLWRLYVISEIIMKKPLQEEFGVNFSDMPHYRSFNKLVTQTPALAGRLMKDQPAHRTIVPNFSILLETTRYFAAQGNTTFQTALRIASAIEPLRNHRNVLVHDGRGLDRQSFMEILKRDNLYFHDILHKLDIEFNLQGESDCGLFDRVRQVIRQMLA